MTDSRDLMEVKRINQRISEDRIFQMEVAANAKPEEAGKFREEVKVTGTE